MSAMKIPEPIPSYGDLMTVSEFREHCESGMFIDYDGHGYPATEKQMDGGVTIRPSSRTLIPEWATHIVWFNR